LGGAAFHEDHEFLGGGEFGGEIAELLGAGEQFFQAAFGVGREGLEAIDFGLECAHGGFDAELGDHGFAALYADGTGLVSVLADFGEVGNAVGWHFDKALAFVGVDGFLVEDRGVELDWDGRQFGGQVAHSGMLKG